MCEKGCPHVWPVVQRAADAASRGPQDTAAETQLDGRVEHHLHARRKRPAILSRPYVVSVYAIIFGSDQ